MPIGDGEVLSIGAQTNGTYYQSYNVSYSTNWFGGKRPIQFSVGAYYSKSTDVSSNYYNSAYHVQLPELLCMATVLVTITTTRTITIQTSTFQMVGVSLGWGKRLRWPDDYFTLSVQLAYQRYMMRNWSYMLMTNGNANNLNLTIALNRTSTDNQLFPRRGSEFEASVNLTPPWSAFDNKDYKNLANNSKSPTYSASSRRSTAGLSTTSGSSRQRPIPH